MPEPHRLLILAPGHFHAALALRTAHRRVAEDIVVYAPDGAERRDFLALVERFNARAAAPTRWRIDVATTDDPLSRLIAERRGDVVVVAGRNGGKARTIRRLHDAGFHVLADKPWLVEPTDLDDVRAALAGWPLVTEIMTGRHDVAARVLKRLVDAPDVFGDFRDDGPALEMASVHQLDKLVDGAPLRRPWWFFDVTAQGRGVVDIPTHLVDRAQWLIRGDPRLVSARTWPTRVPVDAFRRITGEPQVPRALEGCVADGALVYDCNAELTFVVGRSVAHATTQWQLASPAAGGDTALLVAHGTRADVRLEQSARTGRRRVLTVERADARAVADVLAQRGADLPGLRVERRGDRAVEIVVPPVLDGGHETHFALVLDEMLDAIDAEQWPADVATRTLAKYAVLADAAARTAGEPPFAAEGEIR